MNRNPFRNAIAPAAFAAGVMRDGIQLGSFNDQELKALCDIYADEALSGSLSITPPDDPELAGLFDSIKKIGQKVVDVVKKPVIKAVNKIGADKVALVGKVASFIPAVGPIVGGAIVAGAGAVEARNAQKDYEKQLKAQGYSDQQALAESTAYAAQYQRQLQQSQGIQGATMQGQTFYGQGGQQYTVGAPSTANSVMNVVKDPRFFIPAAGLVLLVVLITARGSK